MKSATPFKNSRVRKKAISSSVTPSPVAERKSIATSKLPTLVSLFLNDCECRCHSETTIKSRKERLGRVARLFPVSAVRSQGRGPLGER